MTVRIVAADLREAARKADAVRVDAVAHGDEIPEILLDVEVIIDRSAATAFTVLESQQQSASLRPLRYVGTPRGLAGLISDVQRMGIADGVVLLARSEGQVARLMLDELAPGLGGKELVPA